MAPPRPTLRALASLVALVFGLMTLLSGGGTALFGGGAGGVQDAVGDAVPFVLWFNFLAGFAYLLAGWGGLWTSRPWAPGLAGAICLATLIVLAAFLVHVFRGGAYEPRTLGGALPLRAAVWAGIFAIARRGG